MSVVHLCNTWFEVARKLPREPSILAGVGLLVVAGILDWETGPEIASSLFYIAPVLWMTWKGGRWIGLGTSLASGGIWLSMLLASDKRFESEVIPIWNAFVRTFSFCLVSMLAAEVLARREAEARLRRANEDLQRQTDILVGVSDQEQRRLGEDLHDGLCQHLVSTAFAARKLSTKLAEQTLPESQDAGQIADLLSQAIVQARDVARGLYLVPVEAGGLASALEGLASRVHARHQVNCRFVEGPGLPQLAEAVGTNLFRIAQEAVTNAVKHANSKRITVTLAVEVDRVRLAIEDDGIGFEPERQNGTGIGLHMMRYRAKMIGADFKIESHPVGGTQVLCSVRAEPTPGAAPAKTNPS